MCRCKAAQRHRSTNRLISLLLLAAAGSAHADWGVWAMADAGCTTAQAWYGQENPRSEPTGMRNVAYPEANATYWGMVLTQPLGSVATIHGQFPAARYMGLQVYDSQQKVRSALGDQAIDPDPGQNNPFRSGSSAALGSYTVQLVFGRAPSSPPPNTLYSDGLTQIALVYRVYYPDNPDNLTGGATAPVLPALSLGGTAIDTCPPRPLLPASATVYGHLDQYDFSGTQPATSRPATNPPTLTMSLTSGATPYYPSADNNYLSALLSRQYLSPPYAYQLVVMRMRAPTYPDTQDGEAPWLASTERQVRYWSVCENEPLSTGVTRCLADRQSPSLDGWVTYVWSDPSLRPDDATLAQWGASWLPFGALAGGDIVYDLAGDALDNSDGVYWYGLLLYRQTLANPAWTQSMSSVGTLPRSQWQAAMGDYWPSIGYCTTAAFAAAGAGCIGP